MIRESTRHREKEKESESADHGIYGERMWTEWERKERGQIIRKHVK